MNVFVSVLFSAPDVSIKYYLKHIGIVSTSFNLRMWNPFLSISASDLN